MSSTEKSLVYKIESNLYEPYGNFILSKYTLTEEEYIKYKEYKINLKRLTYLTSNLITQLRSEYNDIKHKYGNEYRIRKLNINDYYSEKCKTYDEQDLNCFYNFHKGSFLQSHRWSLSNEYTIYHTCLSVLRNKKFDNIVPNINEIYKTNLRRSCMAIFNIPDFNKFTVKRHSELLFFSDNSYGFSFPSRLLTLNGIR